VTVFDREFELAGAEKQNVRLAKTVHTDE